MEKRRYVVKYNSGGAWKDVFTGEVAFTPKGLVRAMAKLKAYDNGYHPMAIFIRTPDVRIDDA